MTTTAIRCGGCPAAWTGLGRAHCSACHWIAEASGSAFDRHRRQRSIRDAPDNPYGYCVDPAMLRTAADKPVFILDAGTGVWHFADDRQHPHGVAGASRTPIGSATRPVSAPASPR
jgi:hypothetical protein